MESWKKILLRSAGLGGGFAVVGAIILGIVVWWSGRPVKPKSFDTHLVTATGARGTFQLRSDAFHFALIYGFKNNGNADYHLPTLGAFMLINAANGGLDRKDGVKWDNSIVIPSGKTVNVTFDIPYAFSEYNYEPSEYSEQKDVEFAKHRMAENKGAVFFDYENRIEVDAPDAPEAAKH